MMILLESPAYLLDSGFLLSFGCVLGIGVAAEKICALAGAEKKWMKALVSSIALQLVTLPVMLKFFGEVSLAGFFLGTVLVYYLVQWIGRPLVDRFVSESHFKKFDFLLDGKRTELLIFLVFLLPGLPKDALTYLVSFNPKIKPMYLFFLTTLGRTPATVLTVFMGKSLWEGNYILTIVLAGVIVLLAAAGIFIKRKVDKRAAQKHQLSDETADNKYGKE